MFLQWFKTNYLLLLCLILYCSDKHPMWIISWHDYPFLGDLGSRLPVLWEQEWLGKINATDNAWAVRMRRWFCGRHRSMAKPGGSLAKMRESGKQQGSMSDSVWFKISLSVLMPSQTSGINELGGNLQTWICSFAFCTGTNLGALSSASVGGRAGCIQ